MDLLTASAAPSPTCMSSAPVEARVGHVLELAQAFRESNLRAAASRRTGVVDPVRPLGGMAALLAGHELHGALQVQPADAEVALALAADRSLPAAVRDAGARWAGGLVAGDSAGRIPDGADVPDGYARAVADVVLDGNLDPWTSSLLLGHLTGHGVISGRDAAAAVARQRNTRRTAIADHMLASHPYAPSFGLTVPDVLIEALIGHARLHTVVALTARRATDAHAPALLARLCREKPSDAAEGGHRWLARFGGKTRPDLLAPSVRDDLARLVRKARKAGDDEVAAAAAWVLAPDPQVIGRQLRDLMSQVQAHAASWVDATVADRLLAAYVAAGRGPLGVEVLSGQTPARRDPRPRGPRLGTGQSHGDVAPLDVSDAAVCALEAAVTAGHVDFDGLDISVYADARFGQDARVAALTSWLAGSRRLRRGDRDASNALYAAAGPLTSASWARLAAAAATDGRQRRLVELLGAVGGRPVAADVRDLPAAALLDQDVGESLLGAAFGWLGELTVPQVRTALALLEDFDGSFGALLQTAAALTS